MRVNRMHLRTVLSLLGITLATQASLAAGPLAPWLKSTNVTLTTTGITTTTLYNIPVLVRFTAASQSDMFTGVTTALSSGADIRVTKADGVTALPFEIDTWKGGVTGSGAVWVLLDTVPANATTAYTFKVFWDNDTAHTVSNPAGVFSTNNGFLAVYHFNQPSGTALVNATGSGNVATPASGGAPTDDSTSLIGIGKNFDGATQYYMVGTDSTALNLNSDYGPYTITAWVNATSCPTARMAVLSKYANNNNAGTRQYALQTGPTTANWRMTDDPSTLSSSTTNNEYVADDPNTCNPGVWTYLAGTYYSAVAPTADATGAANVSLYVNGGTAVTGVSASQATGTSIGHSSQAYIGALDDISANPRFMAGTIDELTVSNVVRSSDWINLSYQTQMPTVTALAIADQTPLSILSPNIANGFKVQTVGASVSFQIPQGLAGVRILVMDLTGREVWNRNVSAGTRVVSWDGKTGGGIPAAGLYFVRMTADVQGTSKVLAESKIMLAP